MQTYFEDTIPWAFGTRDESETRKLPFLGFMAGAVMSAGIWVALAAVLWVLQRWPA